MAQVPIHKQITNDVRYIEHHSPDVLVDLGILMHIWVQRKYDGDPYEGWTGCSVEWLASATRMGFRRVKAAVDRLESWGIIHGMSTNGQRGAMPLMYRYDIREYKVKQIKGDKVGAYGEVYVWDRESEKLISTKVPVEEYVAFPECPECGRTYHPTEGAGKDDLCAECYIRAEQRGALERGVGLRMKTPYGEMEWSLVELRAKREKELC